MRWAPTIRMCAAGSCNSGAIVVVAIIVGLIGAALGWVRAARRGGGIADRAQYAAAHGLPAFLVTMILMVIAANLGWLS